MCSLDICDLMIHLNKYKSYLEKYLVSILLLVAQIISVPLLLLVDSRFTDAATPYALSFDGANDVVTVADNASLNPTTGDLTITFWVKLDPVAGVTGTTNWDVVIDKRSSSFNGYYVGADRNQCAANQAGMNFAVGNTSGTRIDTRTNGWVCFNYDEWTFFAAVLDRNSNVMKISKNADDTWVSITPPTGSVAPVGNLGIGTGLGVNDFWLHGEIDEVRIWNTARTQEQLEADMEEEIEAETGLVSRWGMNEGSGGYINDSVSGNDGTISGASWVTGYPFPNVVKVYSTAPTSVLGHSATLTGNLTDLGAESSVDVYFKYGTTSGSLDNTTIPVTKSEIGTFSQNITGLAPNTKYYFQAFADGGSSNSVGEEYSFGRNVLTFDGNDLIDAGTFTDIEGASALTVEAWVEATDFTQAIPVGKHYGSTDGSFYLAYINSNSIRFTVINSSNVRVDHTVTLEAGLDTNWHHFAGVYDGSTMRIYFDGNQIGDISTQTGTIKASGRPLRIGNYANPGLDWPWTGSIDEVRVWDVARSQEEIEENMYVEIESDPGLVARYGFNEGLGNIIEDSVGNNDGTITGGAWSSGFTLNRTPDDPVFNSPANSATKVVLSPTLDVTVDDYEEDDVIVTFYGREYSLPDEDFTIAILPDTQYYSKSYGSTFTAQTQWIVDNMDDLNIKIVLHEGDIVDGGNVLSQWNTAMTALNVLDTNNVPNLLGIGNHDYDVPVAQTRDSTIANSYIDYTDWYSSNDWWDGGAYEPGKSDNVYTRMTIGNMDFLFMSLEFGPRQGVLDWANDIMAANPNHKIVIVTHSYMYYDNTRMGDGDSWNPHTYGVASDANDGEEMWDKSIKLNENMFFIVNGHVLGDGLGQLSSVGDNGNIVHQVLANYQMHSSGGRGWLRYYVLSPADDKLYAYTYSPTLDRFHTSFDNQFSLDYNFNPDDDFSEIGENTNVSSGANTTFSWPDLEEGTQYEWFVTVDDGFSVKTSAVKSFTTDNRPTGTFDNDFDAWNSGDVTANYNLIDADSDTLNISQSGTSGIEYSVDNSTWFDATDAGGLSEGLTGLSSGVSPGQNHVFVWDSSVDLPTIEDSTVYLRIRPNDGIEDSSSWVTSSAFGLDNVAPNSVGLPTFGTVTATSIEINKPTSVTENGSGLNEWQVRRDSATELGFNEVAMTLIENSSLSENTQYDYDVQFSDDSGNLSVYGAQASIYTLVNAPTNLTSISEKESIDLSVDSFPNDIEGSSGYYFENTTTSSNSGWIQENTWQDTSLVCETAYDYSVMYRNGDGTETATINISATTDSCTTEPDPDPEETNTTSAVIGSYSSIQKQPSSNQNSLINFLKGLFSSDKESEVHTPISSDNSPDSEETTEPVLESYSSDNEDGDSKLSTPGEQSPVSPEVEIPKDRGIPILLFLAIPAIPIIWFLSRFIIRLFS